MNSLSGAPRAARRAALALVALACALAPRVASATPRPLPFTYGTETNPQGSSEIEQYVDVTPTRARSSSTGAPTWTLGSQFQTEYEYGITDRLELGLYVTWAPAPADTVTGAAQLTEGNGLKQRLRWILAAPGAWPIDVGLYGEIVENDREIELEAKLLLQRRLGRLRIAANLVGEYELYYTGDARDVVLAPTLGATFEITPSVHVGLEGWSRVELPHPAPAKRSYGLGPHVYAGPALLLNFGKLWWSTGVYARLTDAGHAMQPGEPFGAVWGRSIVGIDL